MNLTRFEIIENTRNAWLDNYLIIVLSLSLLGFLSFRGCTNAGLFLLLLPALTEFKTTINDAQLKGRLRLIYSIILVLALPFFAVLISQSLRHDWHIKALDAPARMLLSIPVLFYFSYKQVNFSKLIEYLTAPSLLILVVVILMHPEISANWSGRFATKAVDPTQLGTYALVLTAFCLFSIDNSTLTKPKLLTLQMTGLLAGLFILTGTGTRGSWLVIPFLLLSWAKLKATRLPPLTLTLLVLLFVFGLVLIGFLQPKTLQRLLSGYTEFVAWLDNTNRETSTGFRLTMWQMSWELFKHNPLYGYGDGNFGAYLNENWILSISSPETREIILLNGPHNELLANLLRSGILGGISVLGLFLLTLRFFWKNKDNVQSCQASHYGIAFIICLLFCSISSEVLTMKYTATFYGLIIAGLTAQIICANK